MIENREPPKKKYITKKTSVGTYRIDSETGVVVSVKKPVVAKIHGFDKNHLSHIIDKEVEDSHGIVNGECVGDSTYEPDFVDLLNDERFQDFDDSEFFWDEDADEYF